ncbi:MAG: TonB-dependent receptor plug domain-containing protein, partial [Bacteroidota bacterium]
LDEVVVHGKKEDQSTQISSTIDRSNIEQNAHKNLSDILEDIAGVSTLKNGSGISKPVVHGLFGNRVAVLNNGIAQAGQQWGNDHAPEIDPFVADHLSVVKGASTLAYGGNSLGSVILVEPGKITDDPHIHGSVNYALQSNGWGHTLNSQLEKNGRFMAWRVNGTLKLQGDPQAPDYYLTNTGKREANFSVQLDKKWSNRWKSNLYYSLFNTEIGVLRGSHIGNLTDLEDAIGRDEPFFTKDSFSYDIAAPRQLVSHHLIKVELQNLISDHQLLQFRYGGQLNDRREFDIRRGGRSNIPALSLKQFTHFFEANYQHSNEKGYNLKTGVQFNIVDNTNSPETGVFPLIPDYSTLQGSAFAILQKEKNNFFWETGLRYDWKYYDGFFFIRTFPRSVERFQHHYHNYALSSGLRYNWNDNLKTQFNLGYMLRAPEVNELYSAGLHQGVSGIEEGDPNLNTEKSLKALLSTDWYFNKKFFLRALVYYQNIQDFIYLNPQKEFRLTIRGAFPVFVYEQSNVRIYGSDWLLSFEPQKNLKLVVKYAWIKGRNLDLNQGLINIPANNLSSSLSLSLNDSERFKQSNISVTGKYVFRQNDVSEEQDFLAPPDAYFLLTANVSTDLQLGGAKLSMALTVDNLLNTRYRDYLNRLRYFADELGRSINLNLRYSF